MENKKSPGVISLIGFLLGIAGIIVSMVGMGKFNVYEIKLILEIPSSLFLLYLGYAITAIGAIVWTLGVVKGWDDIPEDKTCAGLRIFGSLPFVAGIVTIFGGLRVYSERHISLTAGVGGESFMTVKLFLIILGAVIAFIAFDIWVIGFLKSKVKTTILLRGNNTRARKLRDLKSELKKISWLSWRDTYKQSGVVLVTLIAFAVVVGVLDLLFNKALNDWILGLFK